MSESDDDVCHLNPSTLAALNEFYNEKLERENKMKLAFENIGNKNDVDFDFEEDWVFNLMCYILVKYIFSLMI